MEAKVAWSHGLSFTGFAGSGFQVPLGASPAVGGENDGFRPMEMILIGLIGCTAMDVISILQKKRQDITKFEVRANAERPDEHPRVFTRIMIEYIIEGRQVNEDAVERAIELSETRYCPGQAMLAKTVPMELSYSISEAS